MTTFNPGDRVRLSSAANAYRRASVGASEGTVVEDKGYSEAGRRTVEWDNGSLENFPGTSEIEHVPAAEPIVVDPELRERALALALKVSGFGSDAESVLASARAFEAYILGDTK